MENHGYGLNTLTTSIQTIIIRIQRCDLMAMESTITRRLEYRYFFAAESPQDFKYRHHFVSFHPRSILRALFKLLDFCKNLGENDKGFPRKITTQQLEHLYANVLKYCHI